MNENWDQMLSLLKAMTKIYPKLKKNEASVSEQASYYANLSLLNDQSDSFFAQLGSSTDGEAQKWFNKCYSSLTKLANNELKATRAMLRPTVKVLDELATVKVLYKEGNIPFWKSSQKRINLFLQGLPVR